MEYKKGNWNPALFDVGGVNFTHDILDDKMAKHIVGDLKKNLPQGGFPK